jgi:2,3-bisphosphoglycerate-independent phosphoglycerate mutase
MTRPAPIALIVLDGFGLAPESEGNAVARAHTPHFDRLWADYPHTELAASGRAVGLPEGQIGNSEVGHMNLGAGREVMQSLTTIAAAIEDGSFGDNDVLKRAIDGADKGGAVHLLGLVSDGGVHSDLDHLNALLRLCHRRGAERVFVHAFSDGRDTAPDGGERYLEQVQAQLDALGGGYRIATVTGRYWAMDRDERWQRTQRAYDAVVCGRGERSAGDWREALALARAADETDEFVAPTVIVDGGGPIGPIVDGDSVLFFNFRADRARQLSRALLGGGDWDAFERCRVPAVRFTTMMPYADDIDAPYAFVLPQIDDSLGEVIAAAGLPQFHTAETEKYAHVTYFFNAKREEPFAGEARNLVPSPKVATYDLQPEMSAPTLTAAAVERLREHDDAFVLLNYANPDMVGHTGVLDAAIAACEAVDRGLGELSEAVLAKGGALIVLADHGNAEKMLTAEGRPHTAHTTNPVPCIVAGAGALALRSGGKLGDVAPTVLALMGLEQPESMTGVSLLER